MSLIEIRESKIESAIVAYCRSRRLYTRKFSSPAHRGVPDRLIAGHGKVLFLELKRPGGKTTVLQDREIAELRAHGMNAYVAYSVDQAKRIIAQYFDSDGPPDVI